MKVLSPAATAWLAYPKDKMHVPTCIPLFSYWIVSSEESEVKDTEKTLIYARICNLAYNIREKTSSIYFKINKTMC
jgi:hypothetical protein